MMSAQFPQPRATGAVMVTAESKHRSRSLQPTVLRRVGGVTLLDRTVKVLCEAGVTRIVVVAGYRSEDVAATIHSHGLPVASSRRVGDATDHPRPHPSPHRHDRRNAPPTSSEPATTSPNQAQQTSPHTEESQPHSSVEKRMCAAGPRAVVAASQSPALCGYRATNRHVPPSLAQTSSTTPAATTGCESSSPPATGSRDWLIHDSTTQALSSSSERRTATLNQCQVTEQLASIHSCLLR